MSKTKLYSPTSNTMYYNEDDGGTSEYSDCMTMSAAASYVSEIKEALKNYGSDFNERGLMQYYDEDGCLQDKVKSIIIDVEVIDKSLYGVTTVEFYEGKSALNKNELSSLKDYIGGQMSDGFGEGFEQQPIQTDDGELYCHLWNSRDFYLYTAEELIDNKGVLITE